MVDATASIIAGLHPAFRPFVTNFVSEVRRAGVPLIVISGTRAAPVADPEGHVANLSFHLAGLAFDVAVIGFTREQIPFWWWQVLGQFWERMGGRWGGRFRIRDVNHFDVGFGTA